METMRCSVLSKKLLGGKRVKLLSQLLLLLFLVSLNQSLPGYIMKKCMKSFGLYYDDGIRMLLRLGMAGD